MNIHFLSWELLGTEAGAMLAVLVATQFAKWIVPKISGWAARIISFAAALAVLYGAAVFSGGLTPATAAIIPFNAAITALAANGAYGSIADVLRSGSKGA